jgi:hypothetical protein
MIIQAVVLEDSPFYFFFGNNFRGKYQDTKLTLEHGEFQMTKFLKDYFQDYDLNKVDLIFY